MSSTDTKSPRQAITDLRFTQRTGTGGERRRGDGNFMDAADIIRFPEEPLERRQPAKGVPGPRIFSLPLREALR